MLQHLRVYDDESNEPYFEYLLSSFLTRDCNIFVFLEQTGFPVNLLKIETFFIISEIIRNIVE